MIKKYAKLYLTFLILVIFSSIQLAQTNPGKGTGVRDADFYGMEIVFVVDVSVSMESDIECVKDFILAVFQVLNDPVPRKNNFHLITFSDYATYHPSIKGYLKFKEKIGEELKKTLEESDMRINTYPKNGLWEVFDLIEKNFIQKVGVVLLISDGEDSRKLDMEKFERDMEMSLKALRNIGFSVFPIFVNTGVERYMREDYMDMLRKLAGTSANLYEIGRNKKGKKNYEFDEIARNLKNDILNHANFNSPRLYSDVKNTEKKWEKKFLDQEEQKNEILVKNEKLNAKNRKLEGDLYKEQSKSGKLEKYNSNLTLENEKYKSNLKWLWIILIVLLSVMVLGIVGFLDYRHEWRWSKSTCKRFKSIFKSQQASTGNPPVSQKAPTKKTPADEKLETQTPETPSLNTLWGKIVDIDKKREYDLMDKKNGYTPDCLPEEIKLYLENRAGKKVIYVRQEEGSIEFFDANDHSCTNNCGYIGEDTRSFIIKNCGNIIKEKKFEYQFLNRLVDSIDKPVIDKKDFVGREKEMKTIRDNFLLKRGSQHILISGMSNSGKTSFIRYLNEHFLTDDIDLSVKYISRLFEFEPLKYNDFSEFENEIEKELNSIPSHDQRKKLIIIDEYDKAFDKFPNEFGSFIEKTRFSTKKPKRYFILAGQRGRELLASQHEEYLSEFTIPIVLSGLDDFNMESSGKNKADSLNMIKRLLDVIQFPQDYLPGRVREKIIQYSSGFPYFIKKILHELLFKWLRDYHMHPLTEKNVDDAVKKVFGDGEIYTTTRACNYDKEFNIDLDKVYQVPIEDMIKMLRKEIGPDGRIEENVFKNTMTYFPTEKKDVLEKRSETFNKKIEQLIDMGLMLREGKYLKPVPYMFFQSTG
ncbi:MAG: VWA domain-containing protein [Candidatus Aminicenantes bacterium]|nr:MAG: VWA domain-containing protein [Candidatus Aminicenantes bacterium]